ncbi:MAG: hypothetical protein M1825_005674, partial [Sarcosagium campestre]
MAFRAIRPSDQTGQSASESTSSDPAQGVPFGSQAPSRKRKAPNKVTPNACVSCKRARSKCDGKQPCFRCIQREEGETCEYRVHVKMAKEEVISKFEELSKQHKWADTILAALSTDGRASDIIERLQRGDDAESIAKSIEDAGPSDSDASQSLTRSAFQDETIGYEVETIARAVSETGLFEGDVNWTNVTKDIDLINHLVNLYFTWIHPVHMLLSEPQFRRSFTNNRDTYCSSLLVNVICAMACHLHVTQQDDLSEAEGTFERDLKSKFMAEARAVITPRHLNKLTTVQALAIMFLVDAGSGDGVRGHSYIKLANDVLMAGKFGDLATREDWQVTVLGVQALNNMWAEFTFGNVMSQQPVYSNLFDGVPVSMENSTWRFYRYATDQQLSPRRSYVLLTATELAKFAFLVSEISGLYYMTRKTPITAHAVLSHYREYLVWKEQIPTELKLADGSGQPLPHVLFLHIRYHTALVHLFRPFIDMEEIHRDLHPNPRTIAIESAQAGMRLLEHYQRLYSIRYQTQLQVYCLLHLSDLLVRYGSDEHRRDAARFCLEALRQSNASLDVCGPLREMFRQTIIECGVQLPAYATSLMNTTKTYTLDQMVDSYTRISYVQPVDQIQQLMDSNIAESWNAAWESISE